MKNKFVQKVLLFLFALALISGNLLISFLPNQIESYPVEDGNIVQWEGSKSPLLHFSVYNIRYINGYKEPVFTRGDFNMLKDIRYPLFPSFKDSYNIDKIFNNTNSNLEVRISSHPILFQNRVTTEETVKSTQNSYYLFGVELLEDPKDINIKGISDISFKLNRCSISITSDGKYSENIHIGDKIIWFESTSNSIKFVSEVKC